MNRRLQAPAKGSKPKLQNGGARSPNKPGRARSGAPYLDKQDTIGAQRSRSPDVRSRDDAASTLWTIWILAGGRSSRMGRDKSRIVVAGKTLFQHVRAAAVSTGLPVRVIRRDLVPNCGPVGGIFTGLTRARTGWCLFLTCDMPLITHRLLIELRRKAIHSGRPVFVASEAGFGFPLALRASDVAEVGRLISDRRFSIQQLAKAVAARELRLPVSRRGELANANTPAEVAALRRRFRTLRR